MIFSMNFALFAVFLKSETRKVAREVAQNAQVMQWNSIFKIMADYSNQNENYELAWRGAPKNALFPFNCVANVLFIHFSFRWKLATANT